MLRLILEEWFKSEGDTVEEGESIVTISSEKLTNDVEAPTSLWHNNIFTHCDTPPYALAFFKSSTNSDATSNTLSAFGIYAASKVTLLVTSLLSSVILDSII
jgi:hypothetical protein